MSTIYEINSNIMRNAEPLNSAALATARNLINGFHKDHKNRYYMALCHNIRYFTIYDTEPNNCEINRLITIGKEVIDCTSNIGSIVDITIADDNSAVEIWIKTAETAECIILFPYDNGIVKVGELI